MMPGLDWRQCAVVESVPGKLSGALGAEGRPDARFGYL